MNGDTEYEIIDTLKQPKKKSLVFEDGDKLMLSKWIENRILITKSIMFASTVFSCMTLLIYSFKYSQQSCIESLECKFLSLSFICFVIAMVLCPVTFSFNAKCIEKILGGYSERYNLLSLIGYITEASFSSGIILISLSFFLN